MEVVLAIKYSWASGYKRVWLDSNSLVSKLFSSYQWSLVVCLDWGVEVRGSGSVRM